MTPTLQSWALFYDAIFSSPDMPSKRWETDVAFYLYGRNYTASTTRLVLDHAARYGTVEECPDLSFDDRDRAAVEALLPLSPQWAHPEFNTGTIEIAVPA